MMSRITRTTLLAGLALLTACETGSTGLGTDTRQTDVVLARGTGGSASIAASAALLNQVGARTSAGPVTLANVSAIEVAITGVRALPASADSMQDAQWVSLNLTAPASVNLVALPTTAEGGLPVARGTLPAGTYRNLRFNYSSATITFKEPVTVGRESFPANTRIPLEIPSGAQNGIRVPSASFTVSQDAGAEVRVIFDAAASVKNIVATGSGRVMMSPVLGATSRGKDD